MEKHKAETREARGIDVARGAHPGRALCAARPSSRIPASRCIAILTLGLGIGANTAIFSVINAAFFAPYPLQEPERLVRLRGQDLKRNVTQLELLGAEVRALPRSSDLVRVVCRHDQPRANVSRQRAGAGARRVVTSTFLETFGATPIAGRFFRADEERGATSSSSARSMWRTRFAADPAVVGRAAHAHRRHLHRHRRRAAAARVLGRRRLDHRSVSVSRA